jgi:hypothetical protein
MESVRVTGDSYNWYSKPSNLVSLEKEITPVSLRLSFVQLEMHDLQTELGTAVAQWLRCCATNRKVAGSVPTGVNGFFIDIKSFRSHYGPGVNSASNRNEYREHFLGVKTAGA